MTCGQLADIGIGEISQTIDRREAVDLTYPHIIDDITFTSPPPKLYQTTSLFKPFDISVWICSLFMIAITSTLLRISSGSMSSMDSIWRIVSIFLRQSVENFKCKRFMIRVVLMSLLLVCMVLSTCYAGCVYSIIASNSEHKIQTIEDLANAQESGYLQTLSTDIPRNHRLFKV